MGFLKKLGRGIKRVVRKNRGGVGRLVKRVGPGLVIGAVTGGVGAPLIAKAASAAKTLGKKAKGLETPKSLVPVIRAAELRVSRKRRARMPGGAPMPSIPTPRVGMMKSTPQAKRSLYTRKKKTKSSSGKTRKAPSAAQLAARAKFAAMAKARAAAKKKAA